MTTRHYLATVHLLVALDDEHPNMEASQAAACDAISEWMREASGDIVDWGYARTLERVPQALEHPADDGMWAAPIEVALPAGEYEEGQFYDAIPESHRIDGHRYPDVRAALVDLTHLAATLNARQHAGLVITPTMWSVLHQRTNEARALLETIPPQV